MMPIILPRQHWQAWLDRDVQDAAALAPLLQPCQPEEMRAYPVGQLVGNPATTGRSAWSRCRCSLPGASCPDKICGAAAAEAVLAPPGLPALVGPAGVVVVGPKVVICLGRSTFNALRRACGLGRTKRMDEAIKSPFKYRSTPVWCQAHTGALGHNNRNKGGVDRVSQDWQRMKEALQSPGLARSCA